LCWCVTETFHAKTQSRKDNPDACCATRKSTHTGELGVGDAAASAVGIDHGVLVGATGRRRHK